MKSLLTSAIVATGLVAFVPAAQARSAYDGSWDLVFVTQRGACDPTYNFSVNITDGIVTHPNLVKFTGHVAHSGAVRASVTVPDKYAAGSGRLSSNSGRGTWSGFREARVARGTGPPSGTDILPPNALIVGWDRASCRLWPAGIGRSRR